MRYFRHTPTSRWLPIEQIEFAGTNGAAYIPDLAREYGLVAADIAVVEQATRPADLDTNAVPRPPRIARLPLEEDLLFRAVIDTLLDLINVERQAGGRQPMTRQQFIAAVRAKL